MKPIFMLFCLALSLAGSSQQAYKDSMQRYFKLYKEKHEVVTGEDRQYFRFFPPDEAFRINAKLRRTPGSKWFNMETSGALKQTFRTYGILEFSIHDTLVHLPVYQSQGLMSLEKYKDLLFVPFTDLTSGESTYPAGRYIDLYTNDIQGDSIIIDFNRAYNPYCAYVSDRFNCPVPPKESQLPVAITAGEQQFIKPQK